MEQIIFLIGRVLFAGFFIISGIKHFKAHESMTGYAKSKGVPSPKVAVFGSGIMIILGGLGVLLSIYTTISLWLISVFLVGVSIMMHDFWNIKGDDKVAEQINFMKNIALLGAALMMLSIPEPWMLGF